MNAKACKIDIQGIVQGVGFRPYVYRLARQYDIKGWVLNSPSGVVIAAEGNDRSLHAFLQGLQNDPPPLAVIRSCNVQTIEPAGYTDFTIKYSEGREEKSALISPDIAICEDCKRETRDPSDRRFEYPFTNCTNCGPRYTIIKDVPYDRSTTTMAAFPMCPQCQREYEDPLHRRFHAQPNACPVCGPHTWLVDSVGRTC
jgi:hydrogenase maturation protein HypF